MIYLAKAIVFISKWFYRIFIGPLFLPFVFSASIINLIVLLGINLFEFSRKDKVIPNYTWDFDFVIMMFCLFVIAKIDWAEKYC